MQYILHSILPIFILIMIGAIIKKFWIKSVEFWKGLEKLSYFLLFPTALFSYIAHANFKIIEVSSLIQSLIFVTLLISGALIWLKENYYIEKAVFTSMFQGSIRFNSYIFIGIASTLYDMTGLSMIAVTLGYLMIVTNILSVLVFNYYIRDENAEYINILGNLFRVVSKLLTNPLILSCLLGLIINHSGLIFSKWVDKLFFSIADSATAIGVMCVGAGLKFSSSTSHIKYATATCFIKLLLTPILTFFSLKLFSITGIAKSVGMLYSSLPCASTSYILAQQMGGDSDLMAYIITVSVMMSLLSITIIMFVFV